MSRGNVFIASLFIFLICYYVSIGQESGSIAATATVINPVGFKTITEGGIGEGANESAGIILQNQFIKKAIIDASFRLALYPVEQRPNNIRQGTDIANYEYYDNWLIQETVNYELNARTIILTLVSIGN